MIQNESISLDSRALLAFSDAFDAKIKCPNDRSSGVKREEKNQQDATIKCLLLTSVSACLGHHHAYLLLKMGIMMPEIC